MAIRIVADIVDLLVDVESTPMQLKPIARLFAPELPAYCFLTTLQYNAGTLRETIFEDIKAQCRTYGEDNYQMEFGESDTVLIARGLALE